MNRKSDIERQDEVGEAATGRLREKNEATAAGEEVEPVTHTRPAERGDLLHYKQTQCGDCEGSMARQSGCRAQVTRDGRAAAGTGDKQRL